MFDDIKVKEKAYSGYLHDYSLPIISAPVDILGCIDKITGGGKGQDLKNLIVGR